VARVEALTERFGFPGAVRFEAGPGGLVRAVVTTAEAEAHVYAQGAQVTHFRPAGQDPVLFLSAASRFAPGAPIRGGVPVVFPWFADRGPDPAAPAHGVARTAEWRFEAVERGDDGTVRLTLRLEASAATRVFWPHDFVLRHRVGIGPALELTLELDNTAGAPVTVEVALHTYLAVADVRQVAIEGLAGATYLDKTDAMVRKREAPDPVRITGETDRVYLGTRATCLVDDPIAGRRLRIEKEGSATTVVWNPWIARARALSDLGADEWPRMLCIETANAHDDALRLSAGARHRLRAVIRPEPRESGAGQRPR
jgi:glucose-6-phosphate 1-epimerase